MEEEASGTANTAFDFPEAMGPVAAAEAAASPDLAADNDDEEDEEEDKSGLGDSPIDDGDKSESC